jgi:hypothetical protein
MCFSRVLDNLVVVQLDKGFKKPDVYVSYAEDESSTFFRNVGTNQAHFTAKNTTDHQLKNSRSKTQRNPQVSLLVSPVKQMNPVRSLKFIFLNISFNIIVPSIFVSSKGYL